MAKFYAVFFFGFNLLLFSFSVSLKAVEPFDFLDLRLHKNSLLKILRASDLNKEPLL